MNVPATGRFAIAATMLAAGLSSSRAGAAASDGISWLTVKVNGSFHASYSNAIADDEFLRSWRAAGSGARRSVQFAQRNPDGTLGPMTKYDDCAIERAVVDHQVVDLVIDCLGASRP